MSRRIRGHLAELENEAIWIIREVAAWFERPVILFSGGKDSIVLTWLARKAFHPAPIPFSLLHIDTGHNFPETLEFRDRFARELGLELIVRRVQDSIDAGRVREEEGADANRNALQTVTLLDALEELGADAALGGARRDEEKARAKERVFSHRNRFGQWDPKNQRPELWMLFNGRRQQGEHFRVFPLSNWTELDIWQYIQLERIPVPALYLAHEREVIRRNGTILARTPFAGARRRDEVSVRRVRFRTVGDATCTGAFESDADTIEAVIRETATARVTERGGRTDDRRSEAAMEDRKRVGYF
jgi:sulfate adenylyltransferase subunit 2